MPEDSKKVDKKNAKDQRKPRQRHQQNKLEKKEENIEESKTIPRVPVPQKPPTYESPPPEFFKNLKRETDEILKITEEENSKYKKKEIQSNWSKYEVQIESYEDIVEQENMGADFEKLIQAPLVAGGHFQFKHEKSWDINTGPTQYDKYFEIDMEDLNVALCAMPFYERNNIEQAMFKDSDILSMNNRATKFKQKYYNDKSYATPETEAHDKILNHLRDCMKTDDNRNKLEEDSGKDVTFNIDSDNKIEQKSDTMANQAKDVNLEFKTEHVSTDSNKIIEQNVVNSQNLLMKTDPIPNSKMDLVEEIEQHDFIFGTAKQNIAQPKKSIDHRVSDLKVTPHVETKNTISIKNNTIASADTKVTDAVHTDAETPEKTKKNPIIESPEDLEKWLDDFLDD